MEQTRARMKRSSNGEWRSCADLGGGGGGDSHGERGVGESRVKKVNMMKKKVALRRKIKRESLKGNLCPN